MMRPALLLLFLALLHAAQPALAKDGEGGGGGDDRGGDDRGGHGGDDRGSENGGDSDGNGGDSDDDDDRDARAAVSSGAILPLAAILSQVEPEFGARMIDADIKKRRGRVIYELELVTRNGRVLEIEVDAATARVLDVEVDD